MRAEQADGTARISSLRGNQRWLVLLGALVLLWPGLLHADVFVFNDTVSYLRGADTLFVKLLGHQNPFFASPETTGTGTAPMGPPEARKMVLYGRSLYFGLFAYTGLLLGSIWVPIVAQALAASAVVLGAVRHFVDPVRERAFLRAFLIALAVLALTPLPWFVCFLMPDLAVGLALLASALLLCGWRRERPLWRAGLLALVAFAALSHSSAVAITALMAFGALALSVSGRLRGLALPAALVLAAAGLGIAGEAAFALATRLSTGTTPVRPPFLTARLIEDGPGRRYLAEHCARPSFVLCRYPVAAGVNAEVFLWDPDRSRGGFVALPLDDAAQVSAEQTRFALAVARAYPFDTAAGLVRDVIALAGNLALPEFLPRYTASQMSSRKPFEAPPPGLTLPVTNRIVSTFTLVLVIAALASLPWIARSRATAALKGVVFVTVGAIALNDVICACLSGPFARYNTRVIWALPLAVVLFWLSRERAQRTIA